MRRTGIVAGVVALWVSAGLAPAGVYNTAEPWPVPKNFKEFSYALADYRLAAAELPYRASVACWLVAPDLGAHPAGVASRVVACARAHAELVPQPERSLALHYLRRVDELEGRERRGLLTPEERSNLGAYHIRLGNYHKAIQVLEAQRQERSFLLLANLATAYELAAGTEQARGSERAAEYYRLALRHRQRALESWPQMYPGMDANHFIFYRNAEHYHLKLLQLRMGEVKQPGQTALKLDPLFGRVQFVGPSGQYEAGSIAIAQWAELPENAPAIVMQLLLWLPFDDRLHWLLGELLNAGGDIVSAAQMLRPLVARQQQDPARWSSSVPRELREHYAVLAKAAEAAEAYQGAMLGDKYLHLKLLCALAPRGTAVGAPGVSAAQESIWTAEVIWLEEEASRGNPPPPASWVPDWRVVGVSFLAGAVVSWLLGQQLRQLRRPRA